MVTSIMDSYLIYDYKVLYPFITNNLFKLMKRGSIHIRKRSMGRRSGEDPPIFGVPINDWEEHLNEGIAMHY